LLRAHREQPAVDVGERGQVPGFVAGILGVQGREQGRQEVVHVRPVGLGMRADRVGELALGEDPGVLGEEAEQQPGEKHVQPMTGVRPVHQPRVGGEQLVEELAHPLGGHDVRVRLGDVLGLLHARPGQEEGEVLVDVSDWDHQVLAGLRVDGEELAVVGDDDEAGAVSDDRRRGLQLVDHREWIAGGLLEVDDVLLRDLGSLVVGDTQRAVAQARDVGLGLSIGEQQVEDELAVVRLATAERSDALLDGPQVQPRHARSPSANVIPSSTTGKLRACAPLRGVPCGEGASEVDATACCRTGSPAAASGAAGGRPRLARRPAAPTR
jgi:hypothetical protein